MVTRLNEEANKICEATEDLKVKQELHRFLIGREGSYVRKLQEESGGCTILFDNSSDVITLAGSKDSIAKAKKLITARVQQLVSSMHCKCPVYVHDFSLSSSFSEIGRPNLFVMS